MKTKTVIWIAVLVSITTAATTFAYWLGYRQGSRSIASPQAVENSGVAGFSRAEIFRMLPKKTWYTHWENKDRKRPTQITIDEDGQIIVSGTSHPWKLELRWVLNEGQHIFVPIDDYTLRGFFIPSGRQKGMFADNPQ